MTADSEPFLIELINERIDALNFLSAEEKAAAKEKNETLLKNDFLNAYRSLGEELSKMEGSSEDLGLHSQPQGKEYYEALLQANTGVDFTVKEVKSYFNGKLQNISSRFVELYTQNPNLFEEMGDGPVYCDFASAEETIDYLEEQVKRDFPALGTLNYAVNQVPDAMKDNFSPAAYLTSRIDTPLSQNEVIYLNGDYDPSLFPTLAHEGYPGHMYQTVYFKSLQKPLARYLMSYGGYDEGWATYVEHNSYRYAPGDQTLLEAWELNSELGECYTALMDIGVHYEGWDRDDFHEVYQSLSDGVTREMSDEFYDLILETPTNYLRYYLMGFLLQDLYDEAQEALGSDFSSVDFHEVILSTGPAPYDILKQQVEAYIDRVQNPAAQSAEAA